MNEQNHLELPADLSELLGEAFEEFAEHVGTLDELTLMVLRGHLVLEQTLDQILEQFAFNFEWLDEANLRFYQKVQAARAFSLDEAENDVWDLILKINSLRNQLAHSLEPEKRKAKVSAVKDAYFGMYDEEREEERKHPDHLIVTYAIALCNGFLVGVLGEGKRFRDFVEVMDRMVNPHRHDES